jgi:hypothetical protein
VNHSTIARWVLRYSPELNKRISRELRRPNRSWRVDETYVRVAGRWTYLYRAIDSRGDTIDFMPSPNRDAIAVKHFLRLALTRWRDPAAGDQCRWTSGVPRGDCGFEASRRTGAQLPLPTCALSQQHHCRITALLKDESLPVSGSDPWMAH